MASPRSPSRDDEEEDDAPRARPTAAMRFEFDCPACDANNPWPDGFKDREEVTCHYCGVTYRAFIGDDGRLRLREQ